MRKVLIATTMASALLLGACGEKVEVPPAYVGKILTKTGYKPETVPPSMFRLDFCMAFCDKLVILEVADVGKKEAFKLFMPKDQLVMAFDVRFTLSMRNDNKSVNSVFDRIPATTSEGGTWTFITVDRVYETYGQPILREVIRTTVADYSINEIASNRQTLNSKMFKAVAEALEGTPLTIKRLAFADLQFPDIITNAKEKAAERRIAIEQAEAQKLVKMVELQAELEQARMNRNIRREKAQTVLEENNIIAKSVTTEYLAYRRLEVLEELAKSGTNTFVPYGALDSVGLSMKIFSSTDKASN